ncbi:polysaccharide pyruvyl transferase family protein [Zunongwangia sp.]|uniref:polysaccharide pyruvyl transferase family protein n=1 Tax=Zunongwangia sp. TaxID=1965325 RepID=UPI003AA9C384
MKLIYYQENKNFGDALNPYIFNRLLPNFFDEEPSSIFLGIGSILQFRFPEAKKKIVFSTGYAYGKPPILDSSYDIQCVRGPLTAKKLKMDTKLAITDGAALLKTFSFPKKTKTIKVAFMPHHESALFYDWKKVCEIVSFQYINPLDDFEKILQTILSSELIITEAMHGAIVADVFRVPWVPLKLYPLINEFKWQDWTASLQLKYKPNYCKPLYDITATQQKVKTRLKADNFLTKNLSKVYFNYQEMIKKDKLLKDFEGLKNAPSFLSNEPVLDVKVAQLQEKISVIQKKYSRINML